MKGKERFLCVLVFVLLLLSKPVFAQREQDIESTDTGGSSQVVEATVTEQPVTTTKVENSVESVESEDSMDMSESSIHEENSSAEKPMLAETPAAVNTDYEFDAERQEITGYKGTNTDLVIPEQIDGIAVKAIGNKVFSRKGITSVVLPESLERIGEGAFSGNQLQEIRLPNGLQMIEKMGFASNKNLQKITFGENLTEIGDSAFSGGQLTALSLPNSLKKIGRMAFAANKQISQVQFNEGLEIIGQQSFLNCSSWKGTAWIPSTVQWIAPQAFARTGITKLQIAGDASSQRIQIADNINRSVLQTISFENPQKRASIDTLAIIDVTDGTVDLGRLEVTANSMEDVKKILSENLHQDFSVIYTSQTDINDTKEISHGIDWNTDSLEIKETMSLTGTGTPFTAEEVPPIEGYFKNDPQNNFTYRIDLVRVAEEWNAEDFTYGVMSHKYPMQPETELFVITGFSEQGKQKVKNNKTLIFPKYRIQNGKERLIEGISAYAFPEIALDKVVFPNTEGEAKYVIGTNAFNHTGLKEVVFQEGLNFIGPGAFQKNQLTKVVLPSTLFATGNHSFSENQIQQLLISDFVEKVQIDNYSFAFNQLKKVDLPYSIFKFRDFVFMGNPGMEPLTGEDMGVVYLYTRNPAHLGTDTYIAVSKYHKIIDISNGVKRDDLFIQISESRKISFEDYDEVAQSEFLQKLETAQSVFSDPDATQANIDQQKDILVKALATLRATAPDKTVLRDLVKKAEDNVKQAFTEESYRLLEEKLETAKTLLSKKDASKEQLDEAAKELQNAMDQLVISEQYQYRTEDFVFDGNTVVGLSDRGKEKFQWNKQLIIPERTDQGLPVEIIGKKAFQTTEGVIYGTDVVDSPNGFLSVVLPKTLKRIESYAFATNALKEIDLPKTIEYIGDMAFNGNKLESLILPDSITDLGHGAFSLNNLAKVQLSKNLTKIADGLFSRNYRLTQIDLHEGLTEIGKSAFMGDALKTIKLPSTVRIIHNMAFNGHRMEALRIPGTVKSIEKQAFGQNVKFRTLKNLILEEGIENIGSGAFKSCLLQTVKLPKSLKTLASDAFKDNLDEHKNGIVVTLFTHNKDHLTLQTAASLKNQEIKYVELDNEKYDVQPMKKYFEIRQGEMVEKAAAYLDFKALPNGTIVRWEKLPDTTKSGEKSGVLFVTFPDLSTKRVEVIFVVSAIEQPTEPEIPVKPESPVDPEQPIEPENPEIPEQPTDAEKSIPIEVVASHTVAKKNLPQTGVELSMLGYNIGLIAIGIILRKKKEA